VRWAHPPLFGGRDQALFAIAKALTGDGDAPGQRF